MGPRRASGARGPPGLWLRIGDLWLSGGQGGVQRPSANQDDIPSFCPSRRLLVHAPACPPPMARDWGKTFCSRVRVLAELPWSCGGWRAWGMLSPGGCQLCLPAPSKPVLGPPEVRRRPGAVYDVQVCLGGQGCTRWCSGAAFNGQAWDPAEPAVRAGVRVLAEPKSCGGGGRGCALTRRLPALLVAGPNRS